MNKLIVILCLLIAQDLKSQEKLNSRFFKESIDHYFKPIKFDKKIALVQFRLFFDPERFDYYGKKHIDSIFLSFTDSILLPESYLKKYEFSISVVNDSCFSIIVGQAQKSDKSIHYPMIPTIGNKLVIEYVIRNNKVEIIKMFRGNLN